MEENKQKPIMEDKLRSEIEAQIEFLNGMEPGTKEHASATNDVATLLRALYADLEQEVLYDVKLKELEQKQKQFEEELELKKKQFEQEKRVQATEKKEKKKDRIVDIVFKTVGVAVGIAGLVVPYHFYKNMYLTGLEYEENGCISSQHSKWLFGRIKPGKLD